MKTYTIYLCLLLFVFSCTNKQSENWTHFRGSAQTGHSESTIAPTSWSETENISWKTAIDGKAWSSPVVYGNQVWLSSATPDGDRMFAVCVDFETGEILQEIDLFNPIEPERIHSTNSYATPTPCIEDGRAFFHFGTFGTACVDTKSMKILWKREDLNCKHMQGPASSLIIYKDLLIVHLEGTDVQFITALDKYSGETVWITHRPEEKYSEVEPVYRKSYQTPIVINVNGQDQLISNGAQFCMAYDPLTGKEIWRIFYGEDSTVAVPLFYNGTVYINSGWVVSEGKPYWCRLFAVDPTGQGDVTQTHVKWMNEEYIPQTSTPVIVDGLMYAVTERGMLSCRDAASGEIIWTEKLSGHFDISMLYAGGAIYFADAKATTYVIEPGREYKPISINSLDGIAKATPAILRGSILIRTDKFLYNIKS